MAAEIKGKGQKAFAYTIDLCKREEVYKLAEQVTKEVSGEWCLRRDCWLTRHRSGT